MIGNELKNILKHGLYSIGVAVIVRIILYAGGIAFVSFLEEISMDALIILGSTLLVIGVLLLKIASSVSVLVKIDTMLRKETRKPFFRFITKRLNKLYDTLIKVQMKDGEILDKESVSELTQICFEVGKTNYDGTDSNVPSSYYTLYPGFLDAHEKELQGKVNSLSHRVLITTKEQLKADIMENYEKVVDFIAWHIRNKVDLKRIDPAKAKCISNKYKFPDDTTDIGIWYGQYVLLFHPQGNGKIKLYMRFPGEKEYDEVTNYFHELCGEANSIKFNELLKNGMMERIKKERDKPAEKLIPFQLAHEWKDFVYCDMRLQKEKKILDDIINRYINEKNKCIIFDAAMGTGCEDRYILKNFKKNVKVISNEINPTLQTVAYSLAEEKNIHLEITTWDWLELQDKFRDKFGNKFKVDVILLLGNSLCLLENKEDVKKALDNLYSILAPKGVILVDERNFDYILENKKEIDKDPILNFKYKGDTIYCGERVKGVPTFIDEENDKIIFSYYRATKDDITGIDSRDLIEDKKVGTLEMHPFKKGDLVGFLKNVGFINIKTYSDFEFEGYDDDSDFFIHIAEKPTK